MSLARKMPVNKIKEDSVSEKITAQLMHDMGNGYTIAGLMMDCYGVKESEINKPFSLWKKGLPTLYTRIRLNLEKMVEQGAVNKAKRGRAVYYWWTGKVAVVMKK